MHPSYSRICLLDLIMFSISISMIWSRTLVFLLFSVLFCHLQCSAKTLSSGHSFVIEEVNELMREKRHATSSHGLDEPHHSLHVTSVIQSRFARVTFINKIENVEPKDKEIVFSVRLPEAAFITDFDMIVGGVKFAGKIREKKEAKEQYDRAVEKGNTAGLIAADVRETQTFDVSANVPANSNVEFHLVYQELLKRKLGQYDHTIMVNLKEVIDDFWIDVFITERSGITSVSALSPGEGSGARDKGSRGRDSGGISLANTDVRRSKYQAKITFKPTPAEMRRLIALPEDEQKFTVKYDVTRQNLGGEIQTRDGYFVHFFAPEEDLPVLPKKVVFVIDQSGSMSGIKIEQTKIAFESILGELRDSDQFNIVSFSSRASVWSPVESGLIDVTKNNLNAAIYHVNSMRASGGTNINDAVVVAAKLLSGVTLDDKVSAMIILLTDGNPTSGVTKTSVIRKNVKAEIEGRFSLFCLGFGNDVDHNFLKRMANENDGIARKIYEDSDADLQLEGFFKEVATPLLLNVKMTYLGANADDISKTNFSKYFSGSEVIVVGSVEKNDTGTKMVESTIKGTSKGGEVVYKVKSTEVDGTFQHWHKETGAFDHFIERLWAYFTIRDLMEKKTLSQSRAEVYRLSREVVRLALKYKFVTPLTSMVVTLPEDEITTTPAGPTILPTVQPPCYLRGQTIPRRHLLIRPPIWCPYVLSARDISARSSSQSTAGRIISGARRAGSQSRRTVQRIFGGIGGGSRSFNVPGRSLKIPGRALRNQGSGQGQQGQLRKPAPTTTTSTTSTTTPQTQPGQSGIKVWNQCGGKLDDENGKVQLPYDIRSEPFKCKWRIVLPKDSWIDIQVEILNTTLNEVKITSEGKNFLEHNGGISPKKSLLIPHNRAIILMIIYPADDRWPGIVISYNKAKPGGTSPTSTPSSSSPSQGHTFAIDPAQKNCGVDISSLDVKGGTISSPNYPKIYPNNAYCIWNIINTDPRYKTRFTFIDLDIEMGLGDKCSHDRIIVQQGNTEQEVCGYKIPNEITTSNENITIAFLSDDSLGAGGFKIRYDFVPK